MTAPGSAGNRCARSCANRKQDRETGSAPATTVPQARTAATSAVPAGPHARPITAPRAGIASRAPLRHPADCLGHQLGRCADIQPRETQALAAEVRTGAERDACRGRGTPPPGRRRAPARGSRSRPGSWPPAAGSVTPGRCPASNVASSQAFASICADHGVQPRRALRSAATDACTPRCEASSASHRCARIAAERPSPATAIPHFKPGMFQPLEAE